MKLEIQEFEHWPILKENQNDEIVDIIFAHKISFVHEKIRYSQTFCFHYCIDIHEQQRNLSFEILQSHEQTDDYIFWDFAEKKITSKNVNLPKNLQLTIDRSNFNLKENDNKIKDGLFEEIVFELQTSILNKIKTVALFLDKNNISFYLEQVQIFNDHILECFQESIDDIKKNEDFFSFIKIHDKNILENSLTNKNIQTILKKI